MKKIDHITCSDQHYCRYIVIWKKKTQKIRGKDAFRKANLGIQQQNRAVLMGACLEKEAGKSWGVKSMKNCDFTQIVSHSVLSAHFQSEKKRSDLWAAKVGEYYWFSNILRRNTFFQIPMVAQIKIFWTEQVCTHLIKKASIFHYSSFRNHHISTSKYLCIPGQCNWLDTCSSKPE